VYIGNDLPGLSTAIYEAGLKPLTDSLTSPLYDYQNMKKITNEAGFGVGVNYNSGYVPNITEEGAKEVAYNAGVKQLITEGEFLDNLIKTYQNDNNSQAVSFFERFKNNSQALSNEFILYS
jgi:hypothetical protein